MNRVKFYHGGAPGLSEILPPIETGSSCSSDYGAGHVHDRKKVYITTDPNAALIFAALHPSRDGVVYQVEPYGEIENDPDCDQDDLSFQCDGAIIVGIKRYPVGTLSAVRREILPPELSKFLDYK